MIRSTPSNDVAWVCFKTYGPIYLIELYLVVTISCEINSVSNKRYNKSSLIIEFGLIHYSAFFGSEGHVALDRKSGTGIRYPTLTNDPRRSFKCISPIDSSTHYPAF